MGDFQPKLISGQDLLASLQAGGDSIFSARKLAPSQMESFSKELSGALGKLSELDNSEKLREDAIQNGKAIIKDWRPPSNEQIKTILINMSKELMA